MKNFTFKIVVFVALFFAFSCKESPAENKKSVAVVSNQIEYAEGFSIYKHDGFSIVNVVNPWPNSTKKYTYILKEKNGIIPDSLQKYTNISVPVKNIVVTSTTHIPSLEMLEVENSLSGFPNLDYISSE